MTRTNVRAGMLREEVVLVGQTEAADGQGGQTVTDDVGSIAFAAQVDTRARTKVLEGGAQVAFTTYEVTLRDAPPASALKDKVWRWTNPEGDTVDLRILGAETSERRRTTKYFCELVPADR